MTIPMMLLIPEISQWATDDDVMPQPWQFAHLSVPDPRYPEDDLISLKFSLS